PSVAAEIMAPELDLGTAGPIPFSRRINFHPFIALNVQQRFARCFVLLIDTLQLESIEPNPATAPFANIYHQAADLHLRQLIEASGTFHGSAPILTCNEVDFNPEKVMSIIQY